MQITSFSYEGTSILVNGRTSNYIKTNAETRRKGAKIMLFSAGKIHFRQRVAGDGLLRSTSDRIIVLSVQTVLPM
jgi:hypothetical protein